MIILSFGFSKLNKKMEDLQNFYNFKKINNELYKSGQPDLNFLYWLKRKYGIKTIVNLRNEVEVFERKFAENYKIDLIHLPITPFLKDPNKETILWFLRLFQDPQSLPVLMHCRRGKDRTGAMIALFRLLHQNWPIQKVLEEMKQNRVNLYWRFFIKWQWKKFKKIYEEKVGDGCTGY